MSKKRAVIHYWEWAYADADCGLHWNPNRLFTTVPAHVTCKKCLRSLRFKRKWKGWRSWRKSV